jgi:hypothetical protein
MNYLKNVYVILLYEKILTKLYDISSILLLQIINDLISI